jgi:hypothetical protein
MSITKHFWRKENNIISLNRRKGAIMQTTKKVAIKGKEYNDIIVTDHVRSYADEPFFIKKEEKAKAFLKKHPIPDHIKTR